MKIRLVEFEFNAHTLLFITSRFLWLTIMSAIKIVVIWPQDAEFMT